MNMQATFVEGVDFEFVSGPFGTLLKRAVREGLSSHPSAVVYSKRPNGETVAIPVDGRQTAIDALGAEWAKEDPHQTHLGFALDPDGQIGVDTIELCHFPR